MSRFIPSFHFDDPASKLRPEWCLKAIDYYYYNTSNRSLLSGKDVKQIDEFSTGEFDMTPFKRMFKSMKKAMQAAADPNNVAYNKQDIDTIGLGWKPLPLIPTKLNSAISIVQKIPVEIKCTAQDALAVEKKEEDINFLKNKPEVEKDLQEVADQMMLGKVDLGTTNYADTDYSDSPFGLDLTDPEQLDVFKNLIYSLNVESAFETALQQFYDIQNIPQVKLLEITDQLKFGVSVNKGYRSAITGMPNGEYVYPDKVWTPESRLPDFSDNTHRYIVEELTALEVFEYFGNEIKNEKHFDMMLNEKESGYCAKNGCAAQDMKTWGSFKMNLIYFEVKTVDWIGVANKPKSKKGFQYLTTDSEKAADKLWGQNTYGFWWLPRTKHVLGIHRLDFSHREKGRESFQNFTTNIYKSQKKSAVELAIRENIRAQIADIKMEHAIMKALPSGKYFDLKYLRGALTGLQSEGYTIDDLIALAVEQNIMIGDTQDFNSPNEGQFLPVKEIVGGLKMTEVQGYMQVIIDANQKISQFTGINEQLTGQSANPEGLVGMQKLLINSSLNALYYINEAIREQTQKLLTMWGAAVKACVEEGGAAKKAIESMVGKKKTKLIDGLREVPLHDLGIYVTISQREEERAKFELKKGQLVQQGVISAADEFMLEAIQNPKDKYGLLAVKEKQFHKRKQQEAELAHQRSQELIAQQGENLQMVEEKASEGKIKQIYAKGDVESRIIQLSNDLGLNAEEFKGAIRRSLQRERMQGQIEKNVKTLEAKQESSNQAALQTVT